MVDSERIKMLGADESQHMPVPKISQPYDDRSVWEKLMNRTSENDMTGERGDYRRAAIRNAQEEDSFRTVNPKYEERHRPTTALADSTNMITGCSRKYHQSANKSSFQFSYNEPRQDAKTGYSKRTFPERKENTRGALMIGTEPGTTFNDPAHHK